MVVVFDSAASRLIGARAEAEASARRRVGTA